MRAAHQSLSRSRLAASVLTDARVRVDDEFRELRLPVISGIPARFLGVLLLAAAHDLL